MCHMCIFPKVWRGPALHRVNLCSWGRSRFWWQDGHFGSPGLAPCRRAAAPKLGPARGGAGPARGGDAELAAAAPAGAVPLGMLCRLQFPALRAAERRVADFGLVEPFDRQELQTPSGGDLIWQPFVGCFGGLLSAA